MDVKYTGEATLAALIAEVVARFASKTDIIDIEHGGHGATTAAGALENLGVTYGTTDLTAGSSELTTGAVYFVYE